MSISQSLQAFKGKPKLIINDRYMGDKGAKEVAKFLQLHGKVEYLQLKNNDITGNGFADIFKALMKNPNIRQIIIEHNKMGEEGQDVWVSYLTDLLNKCNKIQRLNFSNNKISRQGFQSMKSAIIQSGSIKLLQLKYNRIPSQQIKSFVQQLKNSDNKTLLYVQLAGNKIDKQVAAELEAVLKQNREINPIPKDNLMMTGGFAQTNLSRQQKGFHSYQSFSKTNAIDDLSKQNILRHLETILNENKKGTNQLKIKLQAELAELQRKDKMQVQQINDLDKKCNQLIIGNRNMNIEIDRTAAEYRQQQKDNQFEEKVKEERIIEANKQINQMKSKYQQIQNKMNRDHEAKVKQIGRKWETRLRNIEQRIRDVEADSNTVDSQIRKIVERREKLKVDYQQQQNLLRSRIEEQQSQRYRFKLQALQSKVKEIQVGRQKFYSHSQNTLYQFDQSDKEALKQIEQSEGQILIQKQKQSELVSTNKDFVTRNQAIKQEISLKQIAIEKLEQQINRLNEQIELRKAHNREQVDKIIGDHEYQRNKQSNQKQAQIQRLNDLEISLRNYQLENAKLQQEYIILEQKLQVTLNKAVQEVFTQTNLY